MKLYYNYFPIYVYIINDIIYLHIVNNIKKNSIITNITFYIYQVSNKFKTMKIIIFISFFFFFDSYLNNKYKQEKKYHLKMIIRLIS